MKSMRWTLPAIPLLLFIEWSNALAGSLPATLLATPDAIEHACKELPDVGITCMPAGSRLSPDGLGAGVLPLSSGDLFILDRPTNPQVKGFLVLTEMRTAAGNPYYQAAATLFKTGFAGVGMTTTDLYDKPFWKQVSSFIPFDFPGSAGEGGFLASMDQQIATERKARDDSAAAVRAATDKATADAWYRASPEFAAAQAREAVESCRTTIVRAREAIAEDDRVANISGYENKLLREQAAVSIVNCEDIIARSARK